ncbi:MAG TPA: ROK family protein [Firmicutes bacterium]|nr:ROK family protein [Bacillota bacterium]
MKSIPTGSSLLQVRSKNLAVVFTAIRQLGLVSRIELVEYTQLTPSTITNMVNELLRWNLLLEVGSAASQGGRRRTMLSLNAQAGWVIALVVYPNHIQGGLVNLAGQVGWYESIGIDAGDDVQAAWSAERLYQTLAVQAQERKWDVIGAGITGIDSSAMQGTPWWRTYRPKSAALPVKTEYLARSAAMAEAWYGCGRKHASMVYFDAEATPCVGVVLGNELYVGAHGRSGILSTVQPLPLDVCGLDAQAAAMLAAAVFSFDPDLVVLGGSAVPYKVAQWTQWIHGLGLQSRICPAELGSDAGLIGTACIVLEDFFTDPIGRLAEMSVTPQWCLSPIAND